jgi:hypothetical protein
VSPSTVALGEAKASPLYSENPCGFLLLVIEAVIISRDSRESTKIKGVFMPATIDKETAFADLIRDHEDQWIAFIEKDGVEFIVGTGKTAVEAVREASANGHPQATLFKVPSFKARFIFSAAAVRALFCFESQHPLWC